MIEILTPAQVDRARRTGALVADILATLRGRSLVGTNLLELDRWTAEMIRDAGAESCYVDYAPSFGRGPFGHYVCTAVNDAVLHGRPRDQRLADGDLLTLDLAVRLEGVAADSAISFVVGESRPAGSVELIETTQRALAAGIAAAGPGARIGDLSHAIGTVLGDAGYPSNMPFGGPGIGTKTGSGGADGQGGYAAQSSIASPAPLDRYLLAKLRQLVETTTAQLDGLDVAGACDSVRSFVDVLTNWYIRRSRERFWDTAVEGSADSSESGSDTRAAFDTLYTTLEVLTRVTAPLLPLVSEEIWRGLTGERSVHLTDWPSVDELPADDELVTRMDQARIICSVASSLRKSEKLRVRLPLRDLTVVVSGAADLQDFAAIIADEVNVRQVSLLDLDAAGDSDFGVTQKLTVNARAAGPRLGREVQTAIKGSKSGDWSVAEDGTVTSGGLELVEGEYSLETVVEGGGESSRATAVLPGGGFVVLDTEVTPELAAEGLARDVIRAVQQARREAGLDVSDRISLTVTGSQVVWEATVAHQALIVEETLATQFGSAPQLDAIPAGNGATDATVGDGEAVRILVTKLS